MEPWSEWIKRCTHDAEQKMKNLKLEDWISIQGKRKWKWAQRLALTEAFDWTTEVLKWDPTIDTRLHAQRRSGRPKTRWTDDIHEYLQTTLDNAEKGRPDETNNEHPKDNNYWTDLARKKDLWNKLEKGYIKKEKMVTPTQPASQPINHQPPNITQQPPATSQQSQDTTN